MEEKIEKKTRKDYFKTLENIITSYDVEDKDELVTFIEKEIEAIDKKAEKARERAAAKKVAGDELREKIKSKLTDEFQSADEITEAIEDTSATRAKVIARLSQLVKLNEVEKADAKIEDGRVIKVYRLANRDE